MVLKSPHIPSWRGLCRWEGRGSTATCSSVPQSSLEAKNNPQHRGRQGLRERDAAHWTLHISSCIDPHRAASPPFALSAGFSGNAPRTTGIVGRMCVSATPWGGGDVTRRWNGWMLGRAATVAMVVMVVAAVCLAAHVMCKVLPCPWVLSGMEGESGFDVLPGVGCLDEAMPRRGRSDSKLIAHVPDDVTVIMNGSRRVLPGRAMQRPFPSLSRHYLFWLFYVRHSIYDEAGAVWRAIARCGRRVLWRGRSRGGRRVLATLTVTCKMTVAGSADGRRCCLAQRGTGSASPSSLTATSLSSRSSGHQRGRTAVSWCTR